MNNARIRQPAVAGQFYADSKSNLYSQIESFVDKNIEKQDVLGCIMPHAGYMYSGRVAGLVASAVKIKDRVIILGPNHTGQGASFSIMAEGIWRTPLGDVAIDADLAKDLLKHSKYLQSDSLAHGDEHSIEVELPFLQYFRPDFKFVPICLGQADIKDYKALGREIASTLEEENIIDSTLIVASTDMTHYETQSEAELKDKQAIDAMLNLDVEALWQRIHKLNITMCGYAAVIALLSCCKELGAKTAKLIKYQTSGDVTGDKSSVVGYAGLIIY